MDFHPLSMSFKVFEQAFKCFSFMGTTCSADINKHSILFIEHFRVWPLDSLHTHGAPVVTAKWPYLPSLLGSLSLCLQSLRQVSRVHKLSPFFRKKILDWYFVPPEKKYCKIQFVLNFQGIKVYTRFQYWSQRRRWRNLRSS